MNRSPARVGCAVSNGLERGEEKIAGLHFQVFTDQIAIDVLVIATGYDTL